MTKVTLNEMFDNLLHIWNKRGFWNSQMKPFIYGVVNGVHVINLIETEKKLQEVALQLKELSDSGKKILFVATKIQSREAFKNLAEATGHYYVSEKWVPGLLTNFRTIKRRIASYIQLSQDNESGALEVLTKKEKAQKLLILEKLDKAYSWLKDMKKLPDAIFVSDWIYDIQALREANNLNIKSFAIFNTNGSLDLASNMIPANTNAVKSFEYISLVLKDILGTAKAAQKSTIKKLDQDTVSGDKKPATRKPRAKKEETTAETTAE